MSYANLALQSYSVLRDISCVIYSAKILDHIHSHRKEPFYDKITYLMFPIFSFELGYHLPATFPTRMFSFLSQATPIRCVLCLIGGMGFFAGLGTILKFDPSEKPASRLHHHLQNIALPVLLGLAGFYFGGITSYGIGLVYHMKDPKVISAISSLSSIALGMITGGILAYQRGRQKSTASAS